MLNDYTTAARELELSYQGFAAAAKPAQAALSLTKLGDCERQEALFARMGTTEDEKQRADVLALKARDHYKKAAALAQKAGTSSQLVKALTGLALVEETQYHDYGAANSAVTEAMRAASSCKDPRDCRQDALEAKVSLETHRGELFSAASHVNGLLILLKQGSKTNDPYMKYVAYADRAAVYYAMADGCSATYQISPKICYRLFELSKADWLKAGDIASQAGYSYFAAAAQEEIKREDTLRRLTEMYNNHDNIPADTFAPKTAKDVLVTEVLPAAQLSDDQVDYLKSMAQNGGPSLSGPLATYIQASLDEMQGKRDSALDGYLRTIQSIEVERRKVKEDSARSTFLDDKTDLYDHPIMMLLHDKRYSEAFDLIDKTRARVTMDLLRTKSLGLSQPVNRRLFSTIAQKRAEIARLQVEFFSDIFSPPENNESDSEAVGRDQTRLTELEEAYENLLLRVAREAPLTQKIAVSKTASFEELQSSLRQDSSDVLYYYLEDNAVILIHIGPDSVHVRNIFLPRFALREQVTGLIDSMKKQDAAFREDLSKQLYLFLIQPALAWLHSDRLIIIPQGELENLPFQALQDPADGTFAGERFQISYAPSASILLQLKRQRNLAGGALLAADDPSLPGASDEIKNIARFYPTRRKILTEALIRKSDFLQWAGSYDIIHLAVHGEFDGQEPLLSHVNLADNENGEEDLTAAEMLGLPLEHTRLVTLSACETGRVHTTRANEVQGIQQALLFAGAQSLLVSAWKVDSKSTSLWMQTFYREAQTKSPAEAARQAIREMRRDPQLAHPHYWAPFLLVAR
jgi:CHAT domain-containing protein